MQKVLSIIIPVYNAKQYIHMTLDSCLNQNIPHSAYEILCINDGSIDDSLLILEEYAKKYENIRVFNQPNSGVSKTRNRGIELAQGDYIWFVDADDIIANNCLKQLSTAAAEYDVDILNFETEAKKERTYFESKNSFNTETCSNENKKLHFLTYDDTKWMQEVWRYWFKRKLLLDNNICFNSKSSFGEDTMFSFTATLYAKNCARTNEKLYQYYRHDNSATAKINSEKRFIYIDSFIENARYVKDLTKDKNAFWKNIGDIKARYYIHVVACKLVREGSISFAKETIKKMKKFNLYPYPPIWSILKNHSIKQTILNFLKFFLRFEWFLLFGVRCVSLKRKILK